MESRCHGEGAGLGDETIRDLRSLASVFLCSSLGLIAGGHDGVEGSSPFTYTLYQLCRFNVLSACRPLRRLQVFPFSGVVIALPSSSVK